MLSPILEKLTEPDNAQAPKTSDGRSVDLITVDTDEHSELALEYSVSIPSHSCSFTQLTVLDGVPSLGLGVAYGHCVQGRQAYPPVRWRSA